MMGTYQVINSLFKDQEKFIEMFKTGKGLRWGVHITGPIEGTTRFFKPKYVSNLVKTWIPSLDDIQEKLQTGINVADIGCGYDLNSIEDQKSSKIRIF